MLLGIVKLPLQMRFRSKVQSGGYILKISPTLTNLTNKSIPMHVNKHYLSNIQKSGNLAYEIVSELRSFWRVKGFFLTLKCYPNTRLFPYENEEILLYLAKYTQLMTTSFKNLSKLQLINLCKHMTLRDDRNMRMTINCVSQTHGEICVLLSGEAVVTAAGVEESEILPRGSVFGAIQLFEGILSKTHEYIHTAEFINVFIEKGSVLKISMDEFFKHIVYSRASTAASLIPPKPISPPPSGEFEDDEDAEDAAARETIRQKAEAVLQRNLFSFLSQLHLMPPPLPSIFRGSLGRNYDVFSSTEQMVYILIEGSIRVDLKPDKKLYGGRSFLHTRRGSEGVSFPTSNAMPVVRLEAGAIFTFAEEEFSIGSSSNDFENKSSTIKKLVFVPYHFSVVFEKPSVYLSISIRYIRSLIAALHTLDDSDWRAYLDVTSKFIHRRVLKLLPWLNGELSLLSDREIFFEEVIAIDKANFEADVIFNKTDIEPTLRTGLLGTFIKGGFVNEISEEFKQLFITECPEVDIPSIFTEIDETKNIFDNQTATIEECISPYENGLLGDYEPEMVDGAISDDMSDTLSVGKL